ncbi:unnamed protein product, partial [Ascophyllum nodosum]
YIYSTVVLSVFENSYSTSLTFGTVQSWFPADSISLPVKSKVYPSETTEIDSRDIPASLQSANRLEINSVGSRRYRRNTGGPRNSMSIHSFYDGQRNNKILRHGEGEYRYPNTAFRFQGGWKNGWKEGRGVFEVEGGSTYTGEFKDGEIQGKGIKTWQDGRYYDGEFRGGEACGEGCCTSPTGEYFIGSWLGNKRHGHGELTLPWGQGTYVGEFKSHRYHGNGRLVLAKGFRYAGSFWDGEPHGLGTATYPSGSTYNGPFERGVRSGVGGNYTCGVTGICYTGPWCEDRIESPPSKWVVEVDGTDGDSESGALSCRGSADKSGKGKKKGKPKVKKRNDKNEDDNTDKSVVARFNQDGYVVPLRCHCVREACCINSKGEVKTELPLLIPELDSDVKTSSHSITQNQWITQSEESGRTLAVTVHEVSEDPGGTIGPSVPFFLCRPNATDVSERLGRFATDGLVALFEQEKRSFPRNSPERLDILKKLRESSTPLEVECKPPAPTKPSRKTKGKGGERPPDDVGLEVTSEARWESVRKILDSNRCLVLEAGKGLYLKASGIFEFDELEREGNIPTICDEELVGISHGGLSESGKGDNGVIFKDFDGVGGRGFVGKNSPCTVCLDFYLQLNLREALSERDDSMKAKEAAPCNAKVKQERYITLLTCSSKGLEISATVEPWAQPDGYAAAVDDTQAGISERDAGNYAEFGHRNANVRPPTDHSQVSVSERSSSAKHRHGPGDPVDSATWYVSAISVRSGSCTTLAPCASPTVNHGRRNEHDTERVEVAPPDKVTIELAAWHSLAVGVSENNDVPVLFIDGKVLPLRRSQRGLVEGGPGEMELTSDGVFLGGTDGAWSTLAVKNLAVYEKALDDERLAEITHVYSTWRREREVAAHADAQEERKRLEEAKEAGIHYEELRSERPTGADQRASLEIKTVRGEVKINNIVLPTVGD